MTRPALPALVAILTLTASAARAEDPEMRPKAVSVSLEEAVEIAVVRSYRVRNAQLDLEDAKKEKEAAYSSFWPKVDANASYTRNLVVPNPFAGSNAGDVFSGLDAVGWLAFNEGARTDADPNTAEVTFDEYNRRLNEGRAAVGASVDDGGGNPFFVPNNFNFGLSATQIIYNGAAFNGIEATEKFIAVVEAGVENETLQVVADTARAFYGALLAQQQANILDKSVARTRDTVEETKKRVQQGVLPKFSQLSAEVELANLETQLLRAQNQAEASLDNLKRTLGLPPAQRLTVRGELELDAGRAAPASVDVSMTRALEQRPDLKQFRLQVSVLQIQEKVTWSNFLPVVRAFANLGLIGTVPDDRTFVVQDGSADPFSFREQDNSFFDGSYWNPSFNIGVNLTWNIFNGFQTSATLDRNRIETNRAKLALQQLEDGVRIEVEQALRDLASADAQVATQTRNIERAELNYEHAELRVREGVSTQLELREASQQLDQSRLSFRQAIHDYLVAKTRYDVAVGEPPVTTKDRP